MNALELLERPALVLNRHWHAIRTTTVREAIGLVAKGSARIIEPGTFATHDLRTWNDVSRASQSAGRIRSAHLAIAPPEVVLLTTYEGLAVRTVVFSRRNLFKRDRFTCQYCGTQPGSAELDVALRLRKGDPLMLSSLPRPRSVALGEAVEPGEPVVDLAARRAQ